MHLRRIRCATTCSRFVLAFIGQERARASASHALCGIVLMLIHRRHWAGTCSMLNDVARRRGRSAAQCVTQSVVRTRHIGCRSGTPWSSGSLNSEHPVNQFQEQVKDKLARAEARLAIGRAATTKWPRRHRYEAGWRGAQPIYVSCNITMAVKAGTL